MTYRVTIYLDVAEKLRAPFRELLLGSIKQFSRLEPRVKLNGKGLEVELKIDADAKPAAERKARYWIERAAKAAKYIRWTGKTTRNAKVVKWT